MPFFLPKQKLPTVKDSESTGSEFLEICAFEMTIRALLGVKGRGSVGTYCSHICVFIFNVLGF